MNPLKGFMRQNNNPMNDIMQMLNGGANPQVMAQQMLQNNPQARQLIQQMQNQANGRSPKEMALQYAKQQGINEKDLMQLAQRFGLK